MRRMLFVLAFGAALGGLTAVPGRSAPPPDFHVAPQAGPWMVLITYYTGDNAPALAEELVASLRRDYGLSAYLWNKGGEERRKEQERVDPILAQQRKFLTEQGLPADTRLRVKKYRQVEEQFAVLVGGYKDMDAAGKARDAIRKLKPPAEKLMHVAYLAAAAGDRPDGKPDVQREHLNPFASAFLVPNPVAPPPKDPDAGKPDPFLKQLNAYEEFSLLRNPKPWTLVVKVYQGTAQLQSAIDAKQPAGSGGGFLKGLFGGKQPDVLSAAALQAHELAKLLRSKQLGYDAYVLHTRFQSIVTIGGYDDYLDQRMRQDQDTLSRLRLVPQGAVGADALTLIPVPAPYEVPRP